MKNNFASAKEPISLFGFGLELLSALFILFAAMLVSCGKETIEQNSPSYNYFPTQRGSYVIFDVDSIVHSTDDNENDDSVYYYHYQVKEVIDTPFTDGEGMERQVVARYYRADTTQEWSINIVWSQSLSTASAYRWEDNVPYHKMGFPINTNIEWNGNDKNTMNAETYHYLDIHQPKTYNGMSFDSTLTVIQSDENNYVEKIYAKEVYAAGTGLIYKERDDLRKTAGLVVSGTEFKMVVMGYGK